MAAKMEEYLRLDEAQSGKAPWKKCSVRLAFET